MILSKHFLITFLKDSILLPSLSSCFSKEELSFSEELASAILPSIFCRHSTQGNSIIKDVWGERVGDKVTERSKKNQTVEGIFFTYKGNEI